MSAKLGLAVLLALPASIALAQDARPSVERPGTREWAWDGGDTLSVGGSMIVKVSKDGPPRVVMTGPEEALKYAYLRRGRLGLDDSNNGWWRNWRDQGPLQVTITGVTLADVTASGATRIMLGSLTQRSLDLRVSGSGSITAGGRIEELHVRVSGSGDARLDGMTARQGDVVVSGSGRVDISAVDDADVGISGSGQVRIASAPRALSQSISGSGRLSAGGVSYSRRNRRDRD